MSEWPVTGRPLLLRAGSHLCLTADPTYPLVCCGCENMSTHWLAGQCYSGLSGLTNCLVYVCLSATWTNLSWLDSGLSFCCPIIFPEPGPLNSLLLGQTCLSHVYCSCVIEGWPGQHCFYEDRDTYLLVSGVGCWKDLYGQQKLSALDISWYLEEKKTTHWYFLLSLDICNHLIWQDWNSYMAAVFVWCWPGFECVIWPWWAVLNYDCYGISAFACLCYDSQLSSSGRDLQTLSRRDTEEWSCGGSWSWQDVLAIAK